MNKRSLALTRRRFLHTSAAFAGAAPFLVTQAYASWPDRPVKLVVPFAPGGPVDVIARLLQPLLAEELKANFFIENKPGAAGSIGVGQVARAEPDGYTVLITSNTIMINRADRFGLAQLHQLRGRVGRSHHRAYAYLIAPPRKALAGDAAKRLEAIESMEDLGAGFVLATHDLEIRGAGELLGEQQSGQMTEIGLAMYLDMLEQAVKATGTLDDDKLAAYIHANAFQTIVGEIRFNELGEWATARPIMVQFQNVQGSGLDQYKTGHRQVIVHPAEYKDGELQAPFAK